MDLDDIGSKLANLTMYDVRKAYTGAMNWALNVSEIEAKVKEATSDEKWGASSTQMQEIAQATHNFADFNEIMPAIYRNFMEKEAREWRMIYKALQLLEYIVKHGSERVVDDARSHLGTIKILRNFHYIDEQGKDQGINVRNRSKELSALLSDVDAIRQERRKARANKQKYQGGGNGDFVPGSGGGRYGGFGSDSAYAGGSSMGGGGGYGGSSGGGYDGGRGEEFDEYDAGDADTAPPRRSGGTSSAGAAAAPKPAAKPKEPVVDLFSFDDDEPAAAAPAAPAIVAAPAAASKPAAAPIDAFGDDFDDFQTAPAPAALAAVSRPPTLSTSTLAPSRPLAPTRTASSTSSVVSPASSSSASKPAASAGFGFDDLWASSAGTTASSGAAANKGKMSMAEMAKNKSSSAVWGATPAASAAGNGGAASGAGKKQDIFDLL